MGWTLNTVESLPLTAVEEYCDPQMIREVHHVGRLFISAQKELMAQLSVRLSRWITNACSQLDISESDRDACLSRLEQFLILHSAMKVCRDCAAVR